MGQTLVFADSFAHYNTAGIPLKWSSAGGAIETNLAHVRTGLQSLRIQAGDSPTITNFAFPAKVTGGGTYARFTLGFGWQTQSLAGETILTLLNGVDAQIALVQNANGSISVFSGASLLGTTAAGVLTVGPYWYIELTADLFGFITGTQLILTVTSAANVSTQVLSLVNFSTSQVSVNSLTWGGPSNSAWVADFYFASWDGLAPLTLGAPNIYGRVIPIADGSGRIDASFAPPPFNVTPAPWFSQVNAIPQNTGSLISRATEVGNFYANPIAQAFQFDVSSLPALPIASLQVTMLIQMDRDTFNSVPFPGTWQGITGNAGSFGQHGQENGIVDGPFVFYEFPFDTNPISASPWTVGDFTGPSAYQIGPLFSQQG